jgi:tetratricopeptide (TPR) repeat protein
MPAHIFFRVGRYNEAAAANVKAIAVDEDYITQCKAQGIYPAAYYPHNVHFLWIAYSYEGRSADAIDAARKTASKAHDGLPLPTDQFKVAPLHAMVKFAKWDDILKEPRPAEKDLFAAATWHFARGMALVAKGDVSAAENELESVRGTLANKDFPGELLLVNSPPERLGRIAERVLAGQVAWAKNDMDEAIDQFSSAVRLEDSTTYNEPPDWPYPTRHYLGAALLADKQPVEAEAVYLEDLRRRPENGWGLYGLVQALKAQGEKRTADLAQAEARWKKAWPTADVKLTSSRW